MRIDELNPGDCISVKDFPVEYGIIIGTCQYEYDLTLYVEIQDTTGEKWTLYPHREVTKISEARFLEEERKHVRI